MRALLFVTLIALAPSASALTFLSECDDFYMKQQPNGLEFRCRSTGLTVPPWLTIKDCIKASARKDANGKITITCGPGSFQTDPKVSVITKG